jgi:hypothetical protein
LTCVAKVIAVDRDRLALNLVSLAGEVAVAGYSGSDIDGFRDGEWHTVVRDSRLARSSTEAILTALKFEPENQHQQCSVGT